MLINELFEVESDAVVFYGENDSRVSLHDFQAASEIVAWSLREKGVRRASIVTDDACWFAIALLACWIAGIEPVVPGLAGPQLMTREKARYGTILARSQRKFRYGPGTLAIDELVRGSGRIPFHHLDEKPEYSVFTSGSTGEPKEIRRSLGEVCAEASAIISHFRYVFDQTDCFASTVPCRHSFGLMFRVLIPMFVGLPTCRQIFRSEENFLYKKYDSPFVVTSPSFLKRLSDSARGPRASGVVSSGGSLPRYAVDLGEKFFSCPITEIYGTTEYGAIGIRERKESNAVWRPFAGFSVSNSDDRRLQVLSPNDGKVHVLDDLGNANPDGTFEFSGRSGRIVKLEGSALSLDRIEYLIRKDDFIRDAAACPITIGNRDYIGAAIVLSERGSDVLRASGSESMFLLNLRKRLSAAMDPVEIPRVVRIMGGFPEDPMGKLPEGWPGSLFRSIGY